MKLEELWKRMPQNFLKNTTKQDPSLNRLLASLLAEQHHLDDEWVMQGPSYQEEKVGKETPELDLSIDPFCRGCLRQSRGAGTGRGSGE